MPTWSCPASTSSGVATRRTEPNRTSACCTWTIRLAWTVDSVETTVEIQLAEDEPGRKATLRYADGMIDSRQLDGSDGRTRLTLMQSGFDPTNPPYPGWAGWLAGIAELRRCHELPHWRSIWRGVELAGVPEGMFSIDQ